MHQLRTSILKLFFTSNPSDILPIWFFRNMFIYASQQLWLHFVTWTKKNAHNYNQMYSKYSKLTDTQLVQILHSCIRTHRTHLCSPDLRSDPTCLSHEGWVGWLVGWRWRVFFFGVSLKGRANLVRPKGWWDFCLADLRDQFKEDMFCSVPTCPLPFLKGCWRYIISVGCLGLVCNNFFGKDRIDVWNRRNWDMGILFLLEKMDESSLAMWVFLQSFFLVCSLFCRGNIMSVDISWLKIYAQNPPQNRRRRSAMRVWSVSFPTSVRPGRVWTAARTNWRDGRWYFRYDIYGRW